MCFTNTLGYQSHLLDRFGEGPVPLSSTALIFIWGTLHAFEIWEYQWPLQIGVNGIWATTNSQGFSGKRRQGRVQN